MVQKSGFYEDKCYFYRLLGDFSRYGISVATAKLSYSERSKLFTQEDEDNISFLNSKAEKFKTMSLEFYTKADKFGRQLHPLSELRLQNDHSTIVYYAEVAQSRSLAIDLCERSLRAALEEADRASSRMLTKAKPLIDRIE